MESGVYDRYYDRLEDRAIDRIRRSCIEKGYMCIAEDTVFNLHMEPLLKRISLPSLILEMNLSYQVGELSGETDTELYRSFVDDCLCNEQWLKKFQRDCPLLYQYIDLMIKHTEENVIKLIEHFQWDRDLLNREVFADNPCLLIDRIDSADSDTHQNGQRVYILELDNGEKLVYKPRSLAIDGVFQDMVNWVAEGLGVNFRRNQIFNRGDYGWCAWVESLTCDCMEELKRYYLRNGILLAVSYLLGSSDFHYENLIAHGEYPIIIDLEMGVGRRNKTRSMTDDPAQELHGDSVLRTGLLPMFAWNENGEGVNVGAINAAGGDLVPIKVPVIVQPGTINMHIEYAQPKMRTAKNLATLNHQFIEPYQFREEIKWGFERAYRFIMGHKADVMKMMKNWKTVPVRFLANHTQLYFMFLSTSYLPKYIYSENGRRQVLTRIKKREDDSHSDEWVVKQEVEEMMRGDIPYFWYQIGGTTLYSGTGECYPDFFETSVETELIQRLSRMSAENMKQQERLIDSTLLIGNRGKSSASGEAVLRADKCDKDSLGIQREEKLNLEIARTVGDLLLEEAVWDEHNEHVNWIGMMLAGFRESGYLIRPMGPYLYDGWAGVALFIVALARETGERKYAELAEILKRQLFRHTEQLTDDREAERRSSGAYTGEASIAYAYQLLYDQEKDEQYLAYMEKQCAILPKICQRDSNCDVLGGNAGAILVLLNAYDMTGKRIYIDWAKQAGDHLIQSATEYEWGGWGWITPSIGKALTGFAHGASGIMYALARLSDYSGEEKYEAAAHRAFLFEQHYYREEKRDWTDLRYPDEQERMPKYDTAWCHGWGGILMAAKMTKSYVKGEWREQLSNLAVKVQPRERYRRKETGYSLCHGKLGNAVLLYCMGEKELAGQWYHETVQELGNGSTEFRERLGQQECENFGLMSGIAGIGYGSFCWGEKVEKLLFVGRK